VIRQAKEKRQGAKEGKDVTARQLLKYFLELSPWVSLSSNADQISRGNPDEQIRKIGVGFSACDKNLIRAG